MCSLPVAGRVTELELVVRRADGRTEPLTLRVSRVANCGLAGRGGGDGPDPAARDALAAVGVDPPDERPLVVPKPHHLLTTDSEISVNAATTAGEAEFVLYPHEGAVYVGVGVDHKDRQVAATDLHRANSTAPSVVSREVWRLSDLRERWDGLRLRCWRCAGGALEPYQAARLDAFLPPDDLLDRVAARAEGPVDGTAVWSGTVATTAGDGADAEGADGADVELDPETDSAEGYAAALYDPARNRRLFLQYDVRAADWLRGVDLGDPGDPDGD